jgi:DNA-binding transcriptional ArsR family regulator
MFSMKDSDIFKALADPTRLKILEYIKDQERCICEIIPYTGKSQPNVSQHLKILKTAGLIDEHRDGARILLKPSTRLVYQLIDTAKKINST